jgi:hypothetical protein
MPRSGYVWLSGLAGRDIGVHVCEAGLPSVHPVWARAITSRFTAGCQAHYRLPVGPQPPVRAVDRGDNHGTQELARLVFGGGHRLPSVLLSNPVDGLIQ